MSQFQHNLRGDVSTFAAQNICHDDLWQGDKNRLECKVGLGACVLCCFPMLLVQTATLTLTPGSKHKDRTKLLKENI